MRFENISLDCNGIPFSKPSFWLNPKEYGKICSEINTLYDSQYKGKYIAAHASFGIDGRAYVYIQSAKKPTTFRWWDEWRACFTHDPLFL